MAAFPVVPWLARLHSSLGWLGKAHRLFFERSPRHLIHESPVTESKPASAKPRRDPGHLIHQSAHKERKPASGTGLAEPCQVRRPAFPNMPLNRTRTTPGASLGVFWSSWAAWSGPVSFALERLVKTHRIVSEKNPGHLIHESALKERTLASANRRKDPGHLIHESALKERDPASATRRKDPGI